jgi:hypothetical protein
MRLFTSALLLSTAFAFAQDPDPAGGKGPKARELKVKNLKVAAKPAKGLKPTKVTSAAELAKAVPNKDSQDAIAKELDFTKEYVLLFSWGGSGGDKLSVAVVGDEAVFTMKRGLTRDFRPHVKAFAVPSKLKHKVGPES